MILFSRLRCDIPNTHSQPMAKEISQRAKFVVCKICIKNTYNQLELVHKTEILTHPVNVELLSSHLEEDVSDQDAINVGLGPDVGLSIVIAECVESVGVGAARCIIA